MDSCNNPSGVITILQGYVKVYYVDLFYSDSGTPFDLTGCTEIIAAHPADAGGTPIEAKKSLATVAIIGAPGAGRIKVTVTAVNSALLLPNPNEQQFQDLQIAVTNLDASVTGFLLPAVLNIIQPTLGVV